jgi:hypothetical protein
MNPSDFTDVKLAVQWLTGPVAPGRIGIVGIKNAPEVKAAIMEQMVGKHTPEEIEAAWPKVEKILLDAAQQVNQAQNQGARAAQGTIKL